MIVPGAEARPPRGLRERWATWVLSLYAPFFGIVLAVDAQPRSRMVQGEELHHVLPRDAIPAIRAPRMVAAGEARGFMRDEEPVLGVSDGGEARCYSTWLLEAHEIVNDSLGGIPIAASWCPLCFTGVVHVRKIGGRTLEFGVSGSLWKDALVMYDRETGSLWSHVTGGCIGGSLAGRRLQMLPATVTTFGEWRRLHPNTLVLARRQGEAKASRYAAYAASDRQGIFGTQAMRRELEPKAVVQGVAVRGEAAALPHRRLRDGMPLPFELGGHAYVAVRVGGAVHIYERRAGGRLLEMEGHLEDRPWRLSDRETGTLWDAATGAGIRGPLAETALEAVPSTTAYWFAWLNFYPRSRLVQPGR